MIWLYLGFVALVLALLALDLGVFHRRHQADSVKQALSWSALWISLGLAFSGLIYLGYQGHWLGLGTGVDTTATPRLGDDGVAYYNDGGAAMVKYLTGFLVEKSLAIDNIFVIAMIFSAFAVPAIYQHRVLFWGILGALVMRGAMIGVGAALIVRFAWLVYVFGGFLILTGVRMLFMAEGGGDLADSRVVRLVRRWLPVTERFHGPRFLVRAGSPAANAPATPGAPVEVDRVVATARLGALLATPLLLALVLVELTDVIFAVDSIPAIFAITTDPFLVFTSNVFAILGLRSLYFALAGLLDRFRYLNASIAIVLVVVGAKMLASPWVKATFGSRANFYLLALILTILWSGIAASLIVSARERRDGRG